MGELWIKELLDCKSQATTASSTIQRSTRWMYVLYCCSIKFCILFKDGNRRMQKKNKMEDALMSYDLILLFIYLNYFLASVYHSGLISCTHRKKFVENAEQLHFILLTVPLPITHPPTLTHRNLNNCVVIQFS